MKNQLTWPQAIDQCQDKFNEIALSNKMVTWAEESLFAKQAIDKNTKLAECSMQSVQDSIINVAAIGLSLNPAMQYAYLVPEAIKVNNRWVQQCNLKVSFKGLLKIANDSGSIMWAKADVVKEKDVFEYRGPCSQPEHRFNAFKTDRGKTIGSYCIAKTCEGDILVDLIDAEELQKIRGAAKTTMVWDQWFDEMAKKAAIKRASKQWPRKGNSERIDKAIEVINQVEGSEPIEKDITPRVNPEHIGKYHYIINNSNGLDLVYFLEQLRKETNYSEDNSSQYITLRKEIHATIPRGSKGDTEKIERALFNDGISHISNIISDAIENDDMPMITKYWDSLDYSKRYIMPKLTEEDRQFLKERDEHYSEVSNG